MKNERQRQILDVSQQLFLHYGFQKVTLVDIAKELGVSRPTLYQAFPNKEEIFKALVEMRHEEFLAQTKEIRMGEGSIQDKLFRAIEIWIIKPFELINSSPGASDFQDGTFAFADQTMESGYAQFEKECALMMGEMPVSDQLGNADLAHLLTQAVRGFKLQAKEVEELRKLVSDFLVVALGAS
ncbi:MAG: TetR/AcrR family transcriptional regulator [Verrucomicrobiota bacterium]